MDFNLKQWRDQQQQHESEDEHQQNSAKIPKYLLLDSPQQHHHHQHQQQKQEVAALPLFVSSESQDNKITNTHLSVYPDHHSSTPPTAIPTRFPRSGGRYSFSLAQWQELELQALIYRHMVAGASVPAELLQLVKKSLFTSSNAPYYLHHYSPHFQPAAAWYWGKGAMDPEPGRCRRTDGKKWRCSRDVAPEQKYCERHSHKGRPSRSRKPVESSTTSAATLPVTTTPSVSSSNPIIFTPFSIPKPSSHSFDLPSPTQFNSFPRYPDWFTLKEVAPTTTACLYPQQIGGGDTTRTSSIVEDHNQSCLLPRPFIDAWSLGDHGDPKDGSNSIDNTNTCPTPSSPLNSILPLTLSMSAGVDHDHDNSEDNTKDHPETRLSSSSHHHQPLNWMNSWIGSPAAPGGPLAEALCLGISGSGNGRMASHSDELVSPHGHSTSSSTTTLG